MKRVFLTSLIIGMLAGSVFAQGTGMQDSCPMMGASWMGGGRGSQPGDMHSALMGIDLSEKQDNSIDKLRRDHKVKMTELKSEMAGMRAKGKLLIVDDKVNKSEINDFADKISSFSREMSIQRMNHARNVRELLTEEQRLTFDNNVLSKGNQMQGMEKHMRKRMREMRCEHQQGD